MTEIEQRPKLSLQSLAACTNPSKRFFWHFRLWQKESAMEPIRKTLHGDLFVREEPLPVAVQKELLPLLAALITADDNDAPATVQTGGDDDES